jgi:hypothetical protein
MARNFSRKANSLLNPCALLKDEVSPVNKVCKLPQAAVQKASGLLFLTHAQNLKLKLQKLLLPRAKVSS